MAYSDANISAVTAGRSGVGLAVRWESTSPAGTVAQVYLSGRLAWSGTARQCVLPWPSGRVQIDVGEVGPGEGTTDFSGSLTLPNDRAGLSWYGGSYLSETIAGFRVYRSTAAGGAVDYSAAVATVASYPGGLVLDGFGLGRFGGGGFGRSESAYSWTGPPLGDGDWTFGVAAFDAAGNEDASPLEDTIAIAAPPAPPAADSQGVRLTYEYDDMANTVTLTWLASPG